MDKYFIKHIKPAVKKYNLNLRNIIKKAESAAHLSKSLVSQFLPPEIDSPKNWEVARVKYHIACYVFYGVKLFDEKKRVIRDYLGRR